MRLHHLQILLLVAVLGLAALWRVAAIADHRAEYAVDCERVRAGAGHISEWERQACRSF
jgi:hypothetical protein